MIAEDSPAKSARIEIEKDGHIGYLAYDIDNDGWMTLVHTVVPEALQGHGIGGKLVEKAYTAAREHGWKVQLVCPFAVSYVAKHPELQPFTGVKA
jgi:uncharacterized protein